MLYVVFVGLQILMSVQTTTVDVLVTVRILTDRTNALVVTDSFFNQMDILVLSAT